MSFELAILIFVALSAVVLGLVCYHLLGRLEQLERAVQGGLEAPSSRLSREQFERRFTVAQARSQLAETLDTGVLIVVGPEYTEENELARSVSELPRTDLLTVRRVDEIDRRDLGIATTPYLFIVDNKHVRAAQPVASSTDVIEALKHFA